MFELKLEVRDYECDLQGVVNNAVYQHYLEHARHEFIKTKGLDFADLYTKGYSLVVVRAELDYKAPLRSGDSFVVRLVFQQESRVRFAFYQDIFKAPGEHLVLKGKITATCIDNEKRRPCFPDELKKLTYIS